jgi:DNA repair protein RecO (recombination protein O)
MIARATGIAVRAIPYSRTSLVVTWLTPGGGRFGTLAKGARRPKSAFLGQIDLFYTCEILFYVSERRTLPILKECTPLNTRDALRHDWRACAAASYLAALVADAVPRDGGSPSLYRLIDSSLDRIATEPVTPSAIRWFELRLLRALGMDPQFDRCTGCGQGLRDSGRSGWFFAAKGGLVCSRCLDSQMPGMTDTQPVGSDVLAILRRMKEADAPTALHRIACTRGQDERIDAMLGAFMRYHLETDGAARRIALDVIAR